MKRRENYTVDRRQIVRRNSKLNVGENEETIPIDLLIEILSRLPAKTIARFRCVSKQWSSLLREKYFTESFLTRSSTRPRLLFAFQVDRKWHFFSSLQPQNLDEDLTVDYHMSFSGDWYNEVCLSSYGFIYLIHRQMSNRVLIENRVPVICNPSTGQRLTLPKMRARSLIMRSFFGYDPIQKSLKVLCMTVANYRHQTRSREHHGGRLNVLTLGDGKLSWRKIECSFPHYPPHNMSNGICINGVIYYITESGMSTFIACFDVRSEKISFIDAEMFSQRGWILMKYKGKLGVILYVYGSDYELWVLDDKEKGKWSKHVLLNTRHEIMKSVWANDTGEIFWVQYCWTLPFYIYYYNVETKCLGRVEVKGIKEKLLMDRHRIQTHFTFVDHVENVMFL